MGIVRALAAGCVLGTCMACGGSVILVGDGGTAPGSGGTDGSSSTSSTSQQGGGEDAATTGPPGTVTLDVCPPSEPSVGFPCFEQGQVCRYYSSSTTCDPYVCDTTLHWQPSPDGC